MIRQRLDQTLEGTLQHRWMRSKQNVKSEANWSIFRRDFTPGFESLFDEGLNNGSYDPHDPLERYVLSCSLFASLFLECWILVLFSDGLPFRGSKPKPTAGWRFEIEPPHVQTRTKSSPREFRRSFVGLHTYLTVRISRYEKLCSIGSSDVPHMAIEQIPVPPTLIDEAEALYAPRDHPVLQLVPPLFNTQVTSHYNALGRPTVTFDTFWIIYRQLVAQFRMVPNDNTLASILRDHTDTVSNGANDEIPLMENQKEFRNGGRVVGDCQSEPEDPPSSVEQATFSDIDNPDQLDDVSEVESADFTEDE
jgi:hypothetical protein